MDVSPQWVYGVQWGVENLILPISLVLYSISCENLSGTLVLVLEAAKKSGTETRGSRTDKDQNANKIPSTENLTRSAGHLFLLVIAPLDGTLIKLSALTRYMAFWFVRLCFSSTRESVAPTMWETLTQVQCRFLRKRSSHLSHFEAVYWTFLLLKKKRLRDVRQKWIWFKLTFLCLKTAAWQRTGHER